MNNTSQIKKLSVIVPVCERINETISLFHEYKEECDKLADSVEYIYIASTDSNDIHKDLTLLQESENNLKVILLNRSYGEATAVQAGFDHCSGDYILTLPPYKQVRTEELSKLIDQIGDYDIAIAKRWPRLDSKSNQYQTKIFKFLLQKFSGQKYDDIGCGVRLIKAEVLKEVSMYGDQWRFMPLLGYQLGYHSTEVELTQAGEDTHKRFYNVGVYLRRLLDLLTIVFLTKFNKKPLRFFGLVGSSSIVVSLIGLAYLTFEKIAFDVGMSDRPALVLFSLFLVLGCQLIAIGLVGETVIFTHAKNNKEYRIKEIINFNSKK